MNSNERNCVIAIAKQAFSFINPALSDYQAFSQKLAQEVKEKAGNNIQYQFDNELDEIFKKTLLEFAIFGKIFSEESGWFVNHEGSYTVVYDPFCNSTLASKSIHDAAAGITLFSQDFSCLISAVIDYQTGILAICENGVTTFLQIPSEKEITYHNEQPTSLEHSWIALAFEKKADRSGVKNFTRLMENVKNISVGSGHIYWLRLALGVIDAYTDPFGGEPLYEMFACAVAQGAGCKVTNLEGVPFNHTEEIKRFINDPLYRYYPVASKNNALQEELLREIAG